MLQAAGGAGLEEESKLSRLFYLQLYSSVLNAEKETARREARVAREQRLQRLKQSWRSALTSLPRYKTLHCFGVDHFLALCPGSPGWM